MKTCFIINPRSGRHNDTPDMVKRAEAYLEAGQAGGKILMTERAGHGRELAGAAVREKFECVVVIGGDGTVNEVVSAIATTPVTLGLIPRGSGNGLGRHLGIPRNPDRAFDLLRTGRQRAIDTGVVNGVPFVNAMGVGFDAEISRRFNALTRRGFAPYVSTAFRLFFSHQPVACTVRAEGGVFAERAFLLAVANSDQYGNGCFIAPRASVGDGLLDLTVIREVGPLRAAALVARLFMGNLDGSPRVVRKQAASFIIDRDEAGPVHTDGEVHQMGRRLEVGVRPFSLRVIVPSERKA
ncbi:MAG: diacylglycerol kinase family lipid kinase [Opitutaceae bacterium]|nr:diacylglycerol kinase family lipid kinase [Opitutaceae bacterium]